jgi:hypothetical protein
MGFFSGLAFWGKSLAKGIAWPAKSLRGDHKLGPTLRWTLHFVVLACLLVALGFLNQWLGLDRLLRAPWSALRTIWLPLVFLCFYLAGWFAWLLARLLRTDPHVSQWSDIDAAWQHARESVAAAGIDMQSVPVFLLLGRPSSDMRSLFAAAEVPLSVPQTPRDPASPLHVYANSEAVYVACEETSLMGKHASLLEENRAESDETENVSQATGRDDDDPALWSEDVSAPVQASGTKHSVESLQSAVALLVESESVEKASTTVATPAPRPSLLEQADTIERITSRLQHLCSLIAQDRRPYCPINGILVLLPFTVSDDELTAGQTAVLLERDLAIVRRSLEVRCGVITLICDLQDTPGGRELLARFPESQRRRRLGVSYPLLAQCDSEHVPEMIEKGVRWTCSSLVPPIVYRLAQVRGGQQTERAEQFRVNTRLYELVAQLRQRESRLIRLLQRAFAPDASSPWMMTGCYLAATGEDAVRGQGFTGGIFPQLVQVQNHVSWTREALDDDRSCRRLAWAGYTALAVSVVVIVAVIAAL